MNAQIKLRPLGKLMNFIEGNGYKIEYQHDDLVFIDNTAFLFRFDEINVEKVHLQFNIDCSLPAKEKLIEILLNSAKTEKIDLSIANDFEIKSAEGKREEFQLIFK